MNKIQMLRNIPLEIRSYNSWCVWRGELKENGKVSKPPLQVKNGYKADKTNPNHWATFEEAYKIVEAGYVDGLGFCLSRNDPFMVSDLDDTNGNQVEFERQLKIYNNFNSYSEISPSGKGLHVVGTGSIPQGVRRGKIELYSQDAFITFTGNLYNNEPIRDCQSTLDILWAEMNVPVYTLGENSDCPQTDDDAAILDRASKAANGDKFAALMQGDFVAYQSQSEADFALIDMIAFYTKNVEQIKRIWAMSPLSFRNKQTSTRGVPYLDHMIARASDRQIPWINTSGMLINGEAQKQLGAAPGESAAPNVAEAASQAQAYPGTGDEGREAMPASSAQAANLIAKQLAVKVEVGEIPKAFPPGILGDVARYIMQQAPRPCFEIALVGAIGFMAGVCGRAYNVDNSGLNYYALILANTSFGKEQVRSGYDNIFHQLKPTIPQADTFNGPGGIRSGQALINHFQDHTSFVSIIGEFGIWLKGLNSTYGDKNNQDFKAAILDLYEKSGYGRRVSKTIFADKAKNLASVASPAFTMIGESTPDEFYTAIDETSVRSGFLNRLLIVEYKGLRPDRNPKRDIKLPEKLLNDLTNLFARSIGYSDALPPINVQVSDEARQMYFDLDDMATRVLNDEYYGIAKNFWGRVEMKVLKLAALVAVGINPSQPYIDKQSMEWAKSLVLHDIENISARFGGGFVGEESSSTFPSDSNQLGEIVRIIRKWIKKEEIPAYGGINEKMLANGVYTFSAVQQKTNNIACFKKDKVNAASAFKRAMQNLLDSGDIQEMPTSQAEKDYQKRAKCFVIKNYHRFM